MIGDDAARVDLDPFLGQRGVAVGEVLDAGDRAVGESDLDGDGVGQVVLPEPDRALSADTLRGRLRELAGEIEEVAELADDPSAAGHGSSSQWPGGNGPALTRQRIARGTPGARAARALGDKRRKSAVESDERAERLPSERVRDVLEPRPGRRERLLAEDGLSRIERCGGQRRMRVVPGGDDHRVDLGIGDERIGIAPGVARIRTARRRASPLTPLAVQTPTKPDSFVGSQLG